MTTTAELSAEAVAGRITNYLTNGGLFNPELMEHDKVRDLLVDCRDALTSLHEEVEALRAKEAAWEETRLANANLRNENASLKFAVETEKVGAGYLTGKVERLENERDALASELAQCREALAPFAKYIEARDLDDADIADDVSVIAYVTSFRGPAVHVTFGDFRRARSALPPPPVTKETQP